MKLTLHGIGMTGGCEAAWRDSLSRWSGQRRIVWPALILTALLPRIFYLCCDLAQPRDTVVYLNYCQNLSTDGMETIPSRLRLFLWMLSRGTEWFGVEPLTWGVIWAMIWSILLVLLIRELTFVFSGNAVVALFGGVLAAVNPVLVELGGNVLREGPFLFFFALSILSMLIGGGRLRRLLFAFAGGAAAALCLGVRLEGGELLFCILILFVLGGGNGGRSMGQLCAALAAFGVGMLLMNVLLCNCIGVPAIWEISSKLR